MTEIRVWERQPRESAIAYERFLWFRDAGPERSYRMVAERFGVKERSVKDMAYKYRWTDRMLALIEHERVAWREQLGEHVLRARKDQIRASNDLLEILQRRIDELDPDEIPAFQIARMLRDLSRIYDGISPPSAEEEESVHVTVEFKGRGDGDDRTDG